MKKVLIGLGIVFLALLTLSKIAELWLEANLQSMINANPDRAYDVSYESMDFHTFLKGITLDQMQIQPLNIDNGTVIRGSVSQATINGVVWLDLFFNKRLNIEEISFNAPVFEITVSEDTTRKTSGRGMQDLFGDVLSRGKLSQFSIYNGSVLILEGSTGGVLGQIKKMNIFADGLQTDIVQLNHLIPFELKSLATTIDTAFFQINEYTNISIGEFDYDTKKGHLKLQNISVTFTEDWKKVSKRIGKQIDLITFALDELSINGLESSSSFYSDLDIKAGSVNISGLDLHDHRDKNVPRPPDTEKPMFEGMIEAIPIVLKIDTINLKDVNLSYTELGEDKTQAGTANFNDINGVITGITTIQELQQEYGHFTASLNAKLNGVAAMKVKLEVPYEQEAFTVTTTVGPMDFAMLNTSSIPMADIEFESGQMEKMEFHMTASRTSSENRMVLDYRDLKMGVIKDTKKEAGKKKELFSTIANSAVRADNLPDDKKYVIAEYTSERNIYRGPFNFIWQGVKDGMAHIIPVGSVRMVIGATGKKKKGK